MPAITDRFRGALRSFLFPELTREIAQQDINLKGIFSLEQFIDWERHGKVKAGDYTSMVKSIVGWTYACISILSFDVANVPYYIYKRRGKEDTLVDEHPFYNLNADPNPYMNDWELKQYLTGYLEATGSCYLYVPVTYLKRPHQLIILPTQYVNKRIDNGQFFYDYFNGEKTITFTQEEIVHFKYMNLADMYRGLGPVEAARLNINRDLYTDMYQLSLLANRGRPDGVLTTEEDIDESEAKRLLKLWNKQQRGITKAGGTRIIGRGTKYQPISINPKDMDLSTSSDNNMEKIAAAFGVPKHKLNKTSDINRANAYVLDKNYFESTITPRTRSRDSYMTQIVKLYDKTLIVKSDNVIPQDKDFLLRQEKQDLTHAVITVNDVRKRRGMDPVPWGDVPYMPLNMMPIGTPPSKKDEEKSYYIVSKDIETTMKQWKELYWKYYIKRTGRQELQLLPKLSDYFSDQKKVVLANIKKFHKSFEKTNDKKFIAKQVDMYLFNNAKWNAELEKKLFPFLESYLTDGAETLIADFGLGITFDTVSPFIDEFFKGRTQKLVGINRNIAEVLRAKLEEGILEGETVTQLSTRVEEVYKAYIGKPREAWKSLRIARSEVNTANNFGHIEAMRQAAINKKEWIATHDGKARQSHLDNESEGCVGLNDAFQNGSEYPDEPNCRCAVIPCMEEMEKVWRRLIPLLIQRLGKESES